MMITFSRHPMPLLLLLTAAATVFCFAAEAVVPFAITCQNAPPNPSLGVFQCPPMPVPKGQECNLTCVAGSTPSGMEPTVCGNGLWTNVHTCIPNGGAPCASAPPNPANGAFPNCVGPINTGGWCKVVCNDGYKPTKAQATCSNHTWIDVPKCEKVDPGAKCMALPDNPENGMFICTTPMFGDGTCPLRCNMGYAPSRVPAEAICASGVWQTYNLTCVGPETCDALPDTQNGKFSCRLPVSSGGFCPLSCDPGYKGSALYAKCSNSSWGSIPTCKTPDMIHACDAPPPKPLNGEFTCTGSTPNGGTCPIKCDANSTANGVAAQCSYGRWTNIPWCHKALQYCVSQPPNPPHGSFACPFGGPSGSGCIVQCAPGFFPSVPFARCSDGQWFNIPVCMPMSQGSVNQTANLYQTKCVIAEENKMADLNCGPGSIIAGIELASYGLPQGTCPDFQLNWQCHSFYSYWALVFQCLYRATCTIAPSNRKFGNPCPGVSQHKSLAVRFWCGTVTSWIASTPDFVAMDDTVSELEVDNIVPADGGCQTDPSDDYNKAGPSPASSSSTGQSTLTGIIVGSVLAVVVILAAVFLYCRRAKSRPSVEARITEMTRQSSTSVPATSPERALSWSRASGLSGGATADEQGRSRLSVESPVPAEMVRHSSESLAKASLAADSALAEPRQRVSVASSDERETSRMRSVEIRAGSELPRFASQSIDVSPMHSPLACVRDTIEKFESLKVDGSKLDSVCVMSPSSGEADGTCL